MTMDLSAAYILHSRPFRDSSALLECLSHQYGLVSLIARGAKRPRSRMVCYLQPFILLHIAWVGKKELKTLTQLEAPKARPKLVGSKILIGLYLNELLLRMLHKMEPAPSQKLFQDYDAILNTLSLLENPLEEQYHLRQFELSLLAELGYGLDLSETLKGEPIVPELLYGYDPLMGIFEASSQSILAKVTVSGASIIALRAGDFSCESRLREMKKLMRTVITFHLGNKPLNSRKLFSKVKREKI